MVFGILLDRGFSRNVVSNDAGAVRSGKLSFMKLQSVVVGKILLVVGL